MLVFMICGLATLPPHTGYEPNANEIEVVDPTHDRDEILVEHSCRFSITEEVVLPMRTTQLQNQSMDVLPSQGARREGRQPMQVFALKRRRATLRELFTQCFQRLVVIPQSIGPQRNMQAHVGGPKVNDRYIIKIFFPKRLLDSMKWGACQQGANIATCTYEYKNLNPTTEQHVPSNCWERTPVGCERRNSSGMGRLVVLEG